MKRFLLVICLTILLVGCGKEEKDDNLKNDNAKEEVAIQQLFCTSNDFYGNGDNVVYKGTYTFREGKLAKYGYTLEVPPKYDQRDYYASEEIANIGRYKMNLEEGIITFLLTPDRDYWDEYPYKNKSIEDIKEDFQNDNIECNIMG